MDAAGADPLSGRKSAELLWPRKWAELNTVTIVFGHGIAVAPLQAMMAIGALMKRRLAHSADLHQAHGKRGDGAGSCTDKQHHQSITP